MGATTPQSTIKLYNAPEVNTRAGETLFFASAADREAYFATKLVETNVNCTVVKKRYNTIKVKATMATLETCNYLSFINPSYGNKLFYAYIMSTDYLNNEVSLVTYNIDWFMTDMFNVHYDTEVQMVREHLTNKEHTKLADPSRYTYYPDIQKMYTQEPLSCDPETEKKTYKVAGDCVGYLKSVSQYATDNYDAWNVMTNSGRPYKKVGDSWDETAHESAKYAHCLCFTVPKYGVAGEQEANTFRDHLQSLIYDIMTDYTSSTPSYYTPFFVYDPTGQTTQSSTITTGNGQYFIGRFAKGDSGGENLCLSNRELSDTSYARPYMMVCSQSMKRVQAVIDYLNQSGNVASIVGFHEVPICLFKEFFYDSNLSNPASSLGTVNNALFIPIPASQEAIPMNGIDQVPTEDPKLRYFPFSYYTLEGVNNGSRIELKYELSKVDYYANSTDPERGVFLYKGVTINSTGTYFVVRPAEYKGFISDKQDADDPTGYTFQPIGNLEYTMSFADFPEVPYNTDAYAAFIAGKAKELMAENTREGLYYKGADYLAAQAQNMSSKLGVGANALSTLGSIASLNAAGAVSGAGGIINSGASAEAAALRIQGMDVKASMMDAASNTLLDPLAGTEDNPIYDNFQMSRGAYIMPNFHPSSAGGITNLIRNAQRVGVIARIVRRSNEFISKYNNFFKKYGYATADVKIPAICTYMSTPSADDAAYINIPDQVGWPSGKGYSDYYYTETKNMKVDNVCADSAVFIEHLFNGGLSLRKYVPRDN